MAKLPDALSLGQRPAPSPMGRGFQLASTETQAPGQAGAALGEAVSGAGDALLKIEDRIRSARQAAQLSDTLGKAAVELGDQTLKFQRDQDFKTSPDRFKAVADQIGQKYLGDFTDDISKEVFQREYGKLALAHRLNVMTSAAQQERDYNVSQLDGNLEVFAQSAANAQNDLERRTVINQAKLAIAGQRAAGWISDVDAQKREKIFQTKLENAGVLRDINTDPKGVADRLATDPSYAPNIDPLTRQQLQHTALVREQQQKAKVQPIEARQDADKAMTVGQPDQATAEQVSAESGQKPSRITATDIRAQLPKWIANAEQIAEQRHPGDPVYRDLVVGRVKSYVATNVAAQEGEQRQAYQTLIGIVTGVDGNRKPLSEDELFSRPGASDAFTKLESTQQAAVLGFLEHNRNRALGRPAEVNARLVNSIFPRLFLDPNDPRAITKPEQLAQFVPQGLTPEGHTVLARKIDEIQHNPDGKTFGSQVERVRRTGSAMISRSIMGSAFPDQAEEAALRFSNYLDQKVDEYRAAKKDPRLLLTDGTPDYLLKPEVISTFYPDGRTVVSDAAAKIKAQDTAQKQADLEKLPNSAKEVTQAWVQATGGGIPPGKTQDQAISDWRKAGGLAKVSATQQQTAPVALPQINNKGWRLMKDASGRQAYVSPDGKQFEEVK